MHNGKAVWDGTSAEAASVQWKVDFESSPTVKRNVTFEITSGDSAVDVARKLSKAWNLKDANRKYPAYSEGATVVFNSTKPDSEIVGMRFDVLGGAKDRIPAAGTEVEVVPDLWVYRST
jgi:hypothetical protein